MFYKVFSILSLLLIPYFVLSQSTNLGTPFIKNYYKKDYQAGTQTWDILQTKEGRMYFANNDGLLEFDGNYWRTFHLPKRSILRSIELDDTGRIYAGGQNEIGYFFPDESGTLTFFSLLDKLPKTHQHFSDVWQIVVANNAVFFGVASKVYLYENGEFKVIENENGVYFLDKWKEEVFLHSTETGLQKWDGTTFQLIDSEERFIEKKIRAILPISTNEAFIVTLKNGFYKYFNGTIQAFPTLFDDFLKENRIHSASIFGNNKIAIGTTLNGLVTMDSTGKAIRHIAKRDGLQLNNVLKVFTDNRQDLWLGLDNGIDFIQASAPFSMVLPDEELEGAGFSAAAMEGNIYFGTSNGLFFKEWKNYYNPFQQIDFQLVKHTSGQVWGLSKFNEQLFLGHNEGAFEVVSNQANSIFGDPSSGAWIFLPFQDNPSKFIVGTYSGLNTIEKTNGLWSFSKVVPDFYESSRIMVQDDDGDFWMSHPYRGIYKFNWDKESKTFGTRDFYDEHKGLPSKFLNHVFKIFDQIVVGGEKGVFSYDKTIDAFRPFEKVNSIFGVENRVIRLLEDANKNVWFVTETEIGYLKIKDNGIQKEIEKITLPNLRKKLVNGFEFILPLDDSNVFIGAEKGFIHYDMNTVLKESDSLSFFANFNEIKITHPHQKTLFGGHFSIKNSVNIKQENTIIPQLDSDENSIHFSFSSTDYQNTELIEYQYILEGFDEHSSDWTKNMGKEYTNLKWGDYTFQVTAKNANGNKSKPVRFSFEILPPWYATNLAYGIYSLLILCGIFSLIFIPRRQFEKEKAQLESKHQIVVEKSEQAIFELKNEKLESEIEHQNQILASTTMHLVQKSEMLQKLKTDLKKASKNAKEVENKKDLNRLVRMIDQDARLDEDWPQFALFFDKVHDNFTQKLRDKHPNLTPKDHKLCAYLRMNLNTKEIAPLLNISVRGVEISRYRLRKKLEVPTGENLIDFINGI